MEPLAPSPWTAPPHAALDPQLDAAAALLRGRRVAALTGAGCSTESGIPDYRGPTGRTRPRNPIQYLDFMRQPDTRRRYWARSVLGWPRLRQAQPNAAHSALAALEHARAVAALITQNVDRLHQRAGAARVVELHGALAEARCMDCGALEDRDALQSRLLALNPRWLDQRAALAPDGDADLDPRAYRDFQPVGCASCAGMLKPNVVFFGENVPKPTYQAALAEVEAAEALLVVGSSLAVFSGYRFVLQAAKRGLPVVLVNLGPTARGMEHVHVHLDAPAGHALTALAQRLV